jgi:hypothetical protein
VNVGGPNVVAVRDTTIRMDGVAMSNNSVWVNPRGASTTRARPGRAGKQHDSYQALCFARGARTFT